ncbi:malonyl-[acyl-carrier protein] O-methyltransferase BioC [Halieaceae bacterium IMCC14734]|uniref:Malonyl-[acyl-carrier protein] O-methyltransferase n=2 Tax=Candidatus Litorirhabdus singularis TaxID=2518993 RepID=A0ABT3TBW7_9GAMM|nr:malonyl-[acyl-carrier protein] O-methyltransferase BioC [Candidatus Litorirhabdus singularis]
MAAAAAVQARLKPLAVEVAADCNHLLPLFAGDDIIRLLGVLGCKAPPVVPTQRDKTAVARSFGSAAASYDGVAGLQRDIGNALLERHLPQVSTGVATVLDLGCGTGYFRQALQQRCPQATYLGMDLAEGMARHAALESSGSAAWLVGDAEDMPLASGSLQLIFSNLAIQWSENLPLLCTELARVLAPGGRGLLATLGPQTLRELRQAWSVVDGHAHVNQFVPVPHLKQALQDAGLQILSLEQEDRVMVYQHARELLRELKGLGAHNVNAARPAGLTGRRRLEAFYQAYEDQRRDNGLPATYDVIYLEVTPAHG